jgi:hypothetical protein
MPGSLTESEGYGMDSSTSLTGRWGKYVRFGWLADQPEVAGMIPQAGYTGY